MNKKLYQIRCRGMQVAHGGGVGHGHAFVIATNPEEAYRKLRESLDRRDLGFGGDREMQSIELVAEDSDYPDCGMTFYP